MRMRKRDYMGSVIYLILLDIKRPFRKIFGYCDYCKRYFSYPQKRHMNTMYENEESNYCTCCEECFDHIEEYWSECWKEYNNSRGC